MTNWKTTLAGIFAGSMTIFGSVQTSLVNHTPVNWPAVAFGLLIVAFGVVAADATKSTETQPSKVQGAPTALLLLIVGAVVAGAVASACSVFGPPAVKQDKICEQLDFGSDRTVEVCAPLSDLQRLRAFAAERKATLLGK